jgi:hypothetical protein
MTRGVEIKWSCIKIARGSNQRVYFSYSITNIFLANEFGDHFFLILIFKRSLYPEKCS